MRSRTEYSLPSRPILILLVALGLLLPAATFDSTADLEDQLLTVANQYVSARTDFLVLRPGGGGSFSAAPQLRLTEEFTTQLQSDMEIVGGWRDDVAAKGGTSYSDARSTLTSKGLWIDGDTATLQASEYTEMEIPQEYEGDPPFTAWQIDHILSFVNDPTRGWILSGDLLPKYADLPEAYVPADGPASSAADVNGDEGYGGSGDTNPNVIVRRLTSGQQSADDCGKANKCGPNDAISGPTHFPGANTTNRVTQLAVPQLDKVGIGLGATANSDWRRGTMPAATVNNYRYDDMVRYARYYWGPGSSWYNNSYVHFSSDCQNFVSQSLRAGGWTFQNGERQSSSNWYYYDSGITWSYTWTVNSYWWNFAPRRTRPLASVWYMVPSDVLQADWVTSNPEYPMHSIFITAKSQRDIYYTQHTTDRLDHPLTWLLETHPPSNTKYWAYRT